MSSFLCWLLLFQEGEEANTTVDSEGKEEVAAEEEPKAPRELTAEELEAKVTFFSTSSISQYQMMKTLSLFLSRLEWSLSLPDAMASIGEANLLRIFRGLKIFLQLAREEEEKQMTLDEWKAKQAKKVRFTVEIKLTTEYWNVFLVWCKWCSGGSQI